MLSTFSNVSRRSQAKVRFLLSKVRLILFLLVAIFIFALSLKQGGALKNIQATLFDYTSIITKFITSPIRAVIDIRDWGNSYLNVHHKNEKLEAKVKQLEEWALKAHALELENQQLRHLLKISPDSQLNYITVPVLGIVPTPYTKTIVLGAGSEKGIKLRQPVAVDHQIIGRIVEVTKKTSRVLMIQDVNSHIPVILEKSKVQGIVSGDNGSYLIMRFFEKEPKAKIGELLFTSGVGGIYPKGYLIGKVAYQKGEIIGVKSLIQLDTLEYVHVFKEEEASSENIKPLHDLNKLS